MGKEYRITSITACVEDGRGSFWRKARLTNEYDESDSIVVNLNPHAVKLASAVVLHEDGTNGDAFVLSNMENRDSLSNWVSGDRVSSVF